MTALVEIKQRSQVVKNIYMITKVMQMISFSKMNRIKNKILMLKEISTSIDTLLQDSLQSGFIKKKTSKSSDKFLNLVFGSDSGFCGSTNTSMLKQIEFENRDELLFIFGKKIFTSLSSKKKVNFYKNPRINEEYLLLEGKYTDKKIDNLCNVIIEELNNNKFGYVKLSYLDFKNVSYSNYHEEVLLKDISLEGRQEFLKSYLKNKIYHAYISTLGTVFANRIKSMENSNQNAKKIADHLNLFYNKTRQSKINVELLDIISGSL